MTLYLDLDGVFTDFDGQLLNYGIVNDKSFYHKDKSTHTDEQRSLRGRVEECMRTEGFWENLPLCPGAYELWDFCQPFNPVILTALPNMKEWDGHVKVEKQRWIDKYFGFRTPVIYCLRSEKKNFVTNGLRDILLDDTVSNITEWVEVGGFGVLYTDSENSVKKLKFALEEVH